MKSLQPDKEHLRQLEARVESLEAENKALRAALDLREMASRNSLGDASGEEVAQNITAVGQAAKVDDQIEPVSNTLTPAAKIQLFRSRFTRIIRFSTTQFFIRHNQASYKGWKKRAGILR